MNKKIIGIVFILTLIVYFISSPGKTPYNYFVYLAQSLVQGKLYLVNPPSWLNELAPAGGNLYVVYPPMPALLLLPFVTFFGQAFEQQWLAHMLGAGGVTLSYMLARALNKSEITSLWVCILTGFGTIVWYLASSGSAWYLGQITAFFFVMAALVESQKKKRAFLVGIFVGCAYLARLQTILALPFFLFVLGVKDKKLQITKIIKILIPVFIFVSLNALYNLLRFGSLFDKAYVLIPGVLDEPWYSRGLFHPGYIPRHLKTLFWSFPRVHTKFPYFSPSWGGLAIWITTPAFILIFKAPLKKTITYITWFTIIAISLVIFMYGSTGFSQFGYRYAVDFYPFLIFLIILGIHSKPKAYHWLLLAISIAVNLWGVLLINKLGIVGY